MIISLPILKQEYDETTEKVSTVEGVIKCDLDTSVYAETRWEKHFPEIAKSCPLFDYVDRILANKDYTAKVHVASMLKAVYCFIDSDDLPTYKSFAMLFNLGDSAFCNKLINKLLKIFKLAVESSITKN